MYLTGSSSATLRPLYDAGTLGLLNTPSTRYRMHAGWMWAADNGCYNAKTYVGDDAWWDWLRSQRPQGCLFATAPDHVGDHEATVARSGPWLPRIRSLGIPAAFVLQDGATVENVPWGSFDVAFVGGSDAFKLGGADDLIRQAHQRGKRTHVGRVNSGKRFERFARMGVHTADGTFLAFGPDRNLPELLGWIRKHRTQLALWDAL